MSDHASHRVLSGFASMCLVSHPGQAPVHAELRYDTRDPHAVQLLLSLDQSPAITWVFARDLLIRGLDAPAGLGDVRTFPVSDGLVIELQSGAERAVLLADLADVSTFAAAMLDAVPADHDDTMDDFDDAMQAFLLTGQADLRQA